MSEIDRHRKVYDMLIREKVCAGIVLYNPDIELLKKNVNVLLPQVDCIYLYDNASDNTMEINRFLLEYPNLIYERGSENKGIAYALNQILGYADMHGYEWYLSMDQDSICANNLIEEYSKYSENREIAVMCPFILNNGKYSLEKYKTLDLEETESVVKPDDCITSASLNRVKLIRKVNGYSEKLFIDCVDTDLNCKVLNAGYGIIRCNNTYLIQAMGNAKKIPLLSKLYQLTNLDLLRRMQTVAVYSDKRIYYQSRNSHYIWKKYGNVGIRIHPIYMFALFCYFTIVYPLSRNRISMWKNIVKGFIDGSKLEKTL